MAAPILALALGAAVAVALVSCGNRDTKGLLPGDTADQIVTNLDRVQEDASSGSCTSAAEEVATIQDQIASLPASVDSRLRARLEDGASRLADVVNSPGACETTSESTSTTASTESTTTKEKTKSTTVPTSTSTSTTTSTTPTQTTTVPGPPTGGTGTPGGTPVPPTTGTGTP